MHVDLYFHLLCSHKHQNQRRSLGLKLVIIWPVNLQGMLLSSKCSFFAQKCDKSSQHRVIFKALYTWPLLWGLQTCQQDLVGGRILVSSFQNKAVNTDVSVRCWEIPNQSAESAVFTCFLLRVLAIFQSHLACVTPQVDLRVLAKLREQLEKRHTCGSFQGCQYRPQGWLPAWVYSPHELCNRVAWQQRQLKNSHSWPLTHTPLRS